MVRLPTTSMDSMTRSGPNAGSLAAAARLDSVTSTSSLVRGRGLGSASAALGAASPAPNAHAKATQNHRIRRESSAAVRRAASVAIALLPFTLAVVADGLGVHLAFLLVPLLLVLALVVLTMRPVPDDAPARV